MANESAWQEGWQIGSQRAQERRAHKQALSDEEHEQKVTQLVENLKANQAKLSTLKDDKGNPLPGYDEALGNLQNNVRDLRELYHPDKYPGAIQRVGHLLTDALHITNPQERAKKDVAKKDALSAKDKQEALGVASAAPPSPGQTAVTDASAKAAGELTTIQAKMANIKKLFPDATPEQITSWQNELAATITGVKPTPDKFFNTLADTVDEQGKHHYWRVPMVEGEEPEEVDFNGQTLQPKNPPKPGTSKFAQYEAGYRHDHNIPSDQPLTVAQLNYVTQQSAIASLAGSTTISTSLKQDLNGWYVPVTETNKRIPGIGDLLADPLGSVANPGGLEGGASGHGQPAANKPINTYRNPEDQPADVSFAFNKDWAKPGPYATVLGAQEEQEFRQWAEKHPKDVEGMVGPGPNYPSLPNSGYDARGWFHAMKTGDPSGKRVRVATNFGTSMHGSDKFKTPYNGTFSNESMYATPDAPHWEGNGKLVAKDGRLVVDETPTNLGAVKKKAQAVGSQGATSGATHVGAPVLRGRTPEYTAAYKDYETAKGLSKIADLVAQHPDDAINQKRLAVALEKVSAGRFTTQALDYIITSGWGNTIKQWVNNPTHGALPADVIRQLIDGAHENETAKKQVLDDINASEDESGGAGKPSTGTDPEVEAIIKGLKGTPPPVTVTPAAPAH